MTTKTAHFIDDRPMRPGIPRSESVIEVTPKYLIYDYRVQKRSHSRGMLRDLLEAKDSPQSIGKFCKRWGVLGLCKHGLPLCHNDRCWHRKPFRKSTVNGIEHSEYRESIQSIQQFANGIECLLRISSELSQGREGPLEDWERVQAWITRWEHPDWEFEDLTNRANFNLNTRKLYFESYLNALIDDCQLRPRVFRDADNSWCMEMDSGMSMGHGNNLAGLIVMELALMAADSDGFAMCSSCSRPYLPSRRPDSTRRSYCPSCGRDAAVRDASRKYRQRRREAANADKTSPALNKTKKVK